MIDHNPENSTSLENQASTIKMTSSSNFTRNESFLSLTNCVAWAKRNYRIIAGATVLFTITGLINALTQKSVWQGQFQIVLENKQDQQENLFGGSERVSRLLGLSGRKSSLKTEVQILKSPSVLMPVYEFAKAQKAEIKPKESFQTFSNWMQNVDIILEKGTSVLNISYRDTDKSLILPVLTRIGQTYQDYSGRDRTKGLTQSVTFLKKQVLDISQESQESMRNAQAFALDNGLSLTPQSSKNSENSGSASSVEARRAQAQNNVNSLLQQIEAAKATRNRSVYVAPQLKANAGLYSELQSLQSLLEEKSALLKPTDEAILALKRRINSRTAYINQQTIGLLQGKLDTAKAELSSYTRPREVVLKHRELMRKALRDEMTLDQLETQLQVAQLEKARQTNPWELISTPKLMNNPVAPNRKNIALSGIFWGFFIGCFGAFAVEKKRGLIFSKQILEESLPYPLLSTLKAKDLSQWKESIELLLSGPLSEGKGNEIAIIPIGKVPGNLVELFNEKLKESSNSRSIKFTRDVVHAKQSNIQLLLASSGSANTRELDELIQKLNLQSKPIAGWIYIETN